MLAKDLMHREVFSVGEDEPIDELIEVLVREHIHGVPVLNSDQDLVGVVTQQDIFFSTVTLSRDRAAGAGSAAGEHDPAAPLRVRDIMTSPAVFATEDTDIQALCKVMSRLRIHRLPIVHEGRVTGIVSSLDICRALARGDYRP